jgi:hypothetical protein
MTTLKETGTAKKKPAKTAAAKTKAARPKARGPSRTGIVDKMINDFNAKIEDGAVKVSVADFIRLVQLREDLCEDEPTEVKVTWVEPQETESGSET